MSSWHIGNKEVASLHIGNKEIQSIVRVSDSKVLYEKAPQYSISLVSDKATASTGETVTFTATLLDGNSQPVSGETVTFTDGTNILGTGVTNASGICSVSYSWNNTNTLYIKAICNNSESNSVSITIQQPVTQTITLSASPTTASTPCYVTFSVSCTNLPNTTIQILLNNNQIDTITTNANGTGSVSHYFNKNYTNTYTIKAKYNSIESNTVTITLKKGGAVASTPNILDNY